MIGVRPESAPGWGDAGVLIPWQLWREYGDRRTLELSYPGMQAWIEHIRAANPGLIWRSRTGNNYGDWLHVGEDTPVTWSRPPSSPGRPGWWPTRRGYCATTPAATTTWPPRSRRRSPPSSSRPTGPWATAPKPGTCSRSGSAWSPRTG